MKNINVFIQETQDIPSAVNSKRSTARHIIVKLSKIKNKVHKNLAHRGI